MATKTTVMAETLLDNFDIQYDEFIGQIVLKKDVQGQEVLVEAGQMTDNKARLIQAFLERKYDTAYPMSKLFEAIESAASQHVFSSVYDWIESKKWDKKTRLWTIGEELFGVDNPDINKAIGIWIVNLVGGAYGVDTGKFQYTLDIIGNQGTGKTSFLKRLGGQYYTDQFMSFTKKDDFEIMMKNLIVNDDEMQVTAINSDKAFKKFVSTNEFTYRPAYARNSETKKRHFVISRTTNDSSYLTDLGGNRRIIPVIVNDYKIKKNAFKLPDSWYENVLAEARDYYSDVIVQPDKTIDDINKQMESISFENMTENLNVFAEIDDVIMNILKSEHEFDEAIRVSELNASIEQELYSQMIDYQQKELRNQIQMVMQREGYEKKPKKINGKTVRCFIKKGVTQEAKKVTSKG